MIERQVRMMNPDKLADYVEKVYGYAVNHTFSREEADELSQEILFTAVKELPKLRDDSKFEPWLWGIAGNVVKTFRRYQGKQRGVCSYESLENLTWEDDYSWENEELYDRLRTEIAMLSAMYRRVIILYYYDGLSTKQISEKLGVPEGTVTWRLSEARKKLKKECAGMNETALKPVKLRIRIRGEGDYAEPIRPFPHVYISDALSQNILYYCYDSGKTVEELARLCGVPAYYIEDRMENLIAREAMAEEAKGRYRTDFIISTPREREYDAKAGALFEPVAEGFVEAMKELARRAEALESYTAGKGQEELLYLYGMLAVEQLSPKYNPVKWVERPVRYDGCRWSYHGVLGTEKPPQSLGRQESSNLGSRGSYSHITYHFAGFAYRGMMLDKEINVCEDALLGRPIPDTEGAASAIAKGYLVKQEDGSLFVTVPAFTKTQKEKFNLLAEAVFAPVMEAYGKAVRKYAVGYRRLFPEHLREEIARECSYLFSSLYGTWICKIAQEKGLLALPASGSVCDVLIQHK